MSNLRGIDRSKLTPQFEAKSAGRVLILDGDGPAYRVAATCKRLDTAIRRYQQDMLTQLFLTGSESVRIHLTASGSNKAGRYRVIGVKPYQGNRTNKDKPSLLEPLREAIANRENWLDEFDSVFMHRIVEADDGMMQDAYYYGERGVVWSDDKDLRMTPFPYWDMEKGVIIPTQTVGSIELGYTPSGTPKLKGHGPLFFWAQMLMGDTADHIQGVLRYQGKTCGAVGAFNALGTCSTIAEAANLVIDAYRSINQNPMPEGWLLWLLRNETDNFWKYLGEITLSEANRAYINECVTRNWFNNEHEAA